MPSANVIRLNNNGESMAFNMTPVIDIVFQLIIFFALACQFIEAENFPVTVPDNCRFANTDDQPGTQITTVTVVKDGWGRSNFAVGSQKVAASNYDEISNRLAAVLDARLKDLPADSKVVTLRIDKDVAYSEAQYALAGIAASTASDVRLAVIKDAETQR